MAVEPAGTFDESVVVERLRQGDRLAAELVMRHHNRALWRIARGIADSDEASHRFRRKPATCSDRSQPGIPTEASRGGGAV
jgi:hypothetical protein